MACTRQSVGPSPPTIDVEALFEVGVTVAREAVGEFRRKRENNQALRLGDSLAVAVGLMQREFRNVRLFFF